jgi:hypothetical protein
VTISSAEAFTTAEWNAVCDQVVAAIIRGHDKDMGGVPQNIANKNRFIGVFGSERDALVVLLPDSVAYNCEIKAGEGTKIYLKINALDMVDLQPAVVAISNDISHTAQIFPKNGRDVRIAGGEPPQTVMQKCQTPFLTRVLHIV